MSAAQKKAALHPTKDSSTASQKPFFKAPNSMDAITRRPAAMPLTGTMEHRALSELLERGRRGLTSPEFQDLDGSWRLGASVHALRCKGWHIETQWVESRVRRFARYTLVLGVPA